MNPLHFTCVLFLTFLVPMTLLASSVKVFFTDDELNEMGVYIEPSDIEGKEMAA
jgi:hypothetical protein